MPEGTKDSGWQNCFNSVEKYDRELCQTYREQIDTLLVFAGLFSAVVTAFAVESYQWLQDDPLDTSVELLRGVVALLSRNSNIAAPPVPVATSRLSGPAVARINSFWFLSLSLSLSAALVGILCKQWLREYERNVGQSPEMALGVRFIRFQGLEYWKVGSIVMSVPIIMQIALAFFMIGIIELLWRLHTVVACCVTVVAGLTLVFFLATTFLPVIQYAYISVRCCIEPIKSWTYSTTQAFTEPQCAYKSPQAWLVFCIIQPLIEHLLKIFGHQFSSHPPLQKAELALRPADSWVTFDINWVARREHLHRGPRCAFEGLAWVAGNLGEMHLSSWVWHCVWARWLRNRSTSNSILHASMDINSVARSYPDIVALGPNNAPRVRAQALVFQCSLRPDLPINTAIELLLRLAPSIGVNSRWTREAVHAVLLVYLDLSIHIDDGLAVGLFRLAEAQTQALLLKPDGPNEGTQLNAALAFKDILVILSRRSPLRHTFITAMSGLALQWLRSNPPAQVALVARSVFEDLLRYMGSLAAFGQDLRELSGIILVAKLAGMVSEFWPEHVQACYIDNLPPGHPPVMQKLLAMLSDDGSSVQAQDSSGGANSPHPVDGERSNAPILDALSPGARNPSDSAPAPALPLNPRSFAGRESAKTSREHLCIDVRGDIETDAAVMEIDLNCPASPAGARRRSASPPGSPTSILSLRVLSGST